MELFKQICVYATPIITLLSLCWAIFIFCYFHHKYKIDKPVDPKVNKVTKITPKKVKLIKEHTAYRVFVYDVNKRVIKDFTIETKCKAKKEVKKIFKECDKADSYEIVKIKIKK